MQQAFLTYLFDTLDLKPDDSVLLAVSGGVDSMVMLELFRHSPLKIEVAHCNFGLRAEASNLDEASVRAYCAVNEVKCHVKHFKPLEYAEKKGMSMQMAARALRYAWFEHLRVESRLGFLSTAHHLEDSFETALLNLVRGSGVKGLKGILPRRGTLIRPLLFAHKGDILEYAQRNEVHWREDESNESDKYKRNFIRHEITPRLHQLNPNLLNTFRHSSRLMAMESSFIEQCALDFERQNMEQDGEGYSISMSDIREVHGVLLHRFWAKFGFDAEEVERMLSSDTLQKGKMLENGQCRLVVGEGRLHIAPKQGREDFEIEVIEGDGLWETPFGSLTLKRLKEWPEKERLVQPDFAFLNAEKLKFPLKLRPWKKGDRFRPFGMQGSKLVSDFLIDKKVPVHEKDKLCVLLSGVQVVWLVGMRIAEPFGIAPEGKDLIQMHWLSQPKRVVSLFNENP